MLGSTDASTISIMHFESIASTTAGCRGVAVEGLLPDLDHAAVVPGDPLRHARLATALQVRAPARVRLGVLDEACLKTRLQPGHGGLDPGHRSGRSGFQTLGKSRPASLAPGMKRRAPATLLLLDGAVAAPRTVASVPAPSRHGIRRRRPGQPPPARRAFRRRRRARPKVPPATPAARPSPLSRSAPPIRARPPRSAVAPR